jgi:alkylated DNA repair dioxygenase AlkB
LAIYAPLTHFHFDLIDQCVTEVTGTEDGTGTGLLHVNPPIVVYGKPGYQHRSIGFFGKTDAAGVPLIEGYRYSGQLAPAQPLPPCLAALLDGVNAMFQADFNGILVNRYRGGADTIGAHSDDEKFLDTGVVAISWGESRTFRIRQRSDKKIIADIPTSSGTVMVMAGDFQKEFTHEIPAELKKKGVRVSFTFRKHLCLARKD